MRGKSIDTEFIAAFVQQCAAKEKLAPEEICEEALFQMNEIDKQLKLRLKLSDVLSFFKYKKVKIKEKDIVSFNYINIEISKLIISCLNDFHLIEDDFISIIINEGIDSMYSSKDVLCAYKQLLQTKILDKDLNNKIIAGCNYELFIKEKIQ